VLLARSPGSPRSRSRSRAPVRGPRPSLSQFRGQQTLLFGKPTIPARRLLGFRAALSIASAAAIPRAPGSKPTTASHRAPTNHPHNIVAESSLACPPPFSLPSGATNSHCDKRQYGRCPTTCTRPPLWARAMSLRPRGLSRQTSLVRRTSKTLVLLHHTHSRADDRPELVPRLRLLPSKTRRKAMQRAPRPQLGSHSLAWTP
jgi:hypothetical protein